MSLIEILEIAIALIFIFLIFSLLASEIQEQLGAILEFRSKTLRESIRTLLGEAYLVGGEKSLTDALYRTSTIKSINLSASFTLKHLFDQIFLYFFRDLPNKNWSGRPADYKNYSAGPGYMDKNTFVDALFQALQSDPDLNRLLKLNNPNSNIVNRLSEITQEDIEDSNYPAIHYLSEISKLLKLENGEASINDLREALGERFDRSQERITGVYRRNAKGLALTIGAVLVVIVNIDTLHIIQVLDDSSQLTKQLVQVAEGNFIDEAATRFSECLANADSEATDVTPEECLDDEQAFRETISKSLEESSGFKLGQLIGWPDPVLNYSDRLRDAATSDSEELSGVSSSSGTLELSGTNLLPDKDAVPDVNPSFPAEPPVNPESPVNPETPINPEPPNSENYWRNKFIGWSISAIAISMGAPFWFDLLGKFINVRSAGKAILPEASKSKNEQPEKKEQSEKK